MLHMFFVFVILISFGFVKLEGTSFCDESTQAQHFFNLHAIWWDEFKAWRALAIIYKALK